MTAGGNIQEAAQQDYERNESSDLHIDLPAVALLLAECEDVFSGEIKKKNDQK